jgi:hypothetical protein
MLTLVTGTPGAGKTLYVVSQLIPEILAARLEHPELGTIPRRVLTNIPRLMLDHELIDGNDEHGLNGWYKWCKPGDYIIYDEVQKEWPIRPNGSKVPQQIQELETHRHKGVDMILITQGPMLVDQNMRALVGRHIHIRAIGAKICMMYEWDHCSRQLLYSQAINKRVIRHKTSAYSNYASSELHTKQRAKVPAVAYVAAATLLASLFAVPYVIKTITGKVEQATPKPAADQIQPGQNQGGAPGRLQPSKSAVDAMTKRAPPESDNDDTQRPDLSDLLLVGHAGHGDVAVWQVVKNGKPKYSLTHQQLALQPYVINYVDHCAAIIRDKMTGAIRRYWCQPGLVDTKDDAFELAGPAGDNSAGTPKPPAPSPAPGLPLL